MLGIIIDAASSPAGQPNLVFQRLGAKTALERVAEACLKSPYPHKVLLSMPAADRAMIFGSTFQTRMFGNFEHNGRQIEGFFYGRSEDKIERLYRTAIVHNLDDIVVVPASNVLIQTWIIDALCQNLLRLEAKNLTVVLDDTFPTGIGGTGFRFWRLAEAKKHQLDWSKFEQELAKTSYKVANEGKTGLPILEKDLGGLALDSQDKVPLLIRFFEELDAGADLGDLLEDLLE